MGLSTRERERKRLVRVYVLETGREKVGEKEEWWDAGDWRERGRE